MSVDREELLTRLRRVPDRLDRLVEDHPRDLLCQAGAGGAWGAVEILSFLRDWDAVVGDRLSLMLTEDDPEFEDEDPDLWSIERDYHTEEPSNVVKEFRSGREELVARLEKLNDVAWSRTGHLPDGTRITIEELVQQLTRSDKQQLASLREMLD